MSNESLHYLARRRELHEQANPDCEWCKGTGRDVVEDAGVMKCSCIDEALAELGFHDIQRGVPDPFYKAAKAVDQAWERNR